MVFLFLRLVYDFWSRLELLINWSHGNIWYEIISITLKDTFLSFITLKNKKTKPSGRVPRCTYHHRWVAATCFADLSWRKMMMMMTTTDFQCAPVPGQRTARFPSIATSCWGLLSRDLSGEARPVRVWSRPPKVYWFPSRQPSLASPWWRLTCSEKLRSRPCRPCSAPLAAAATWRTLS